MSLTKSAGRFSFAGLFAAGLVAGLFVAPTAAVNGDDISPRLAAQLAAGEFTAALTDAHRLPAPQRDIALRSIASAQEAVGARPAAFATVADIRDRGIRGDVLHQFASSSRYEPSVAPVRNGAAGGGVQPDFATLMDLIQSTIAPETWREAGGTQGEMRSHSGGVYVDAGGAMRPIVNGAELARLAAMRREAAQGQAYQSARRESALRKVSLTRLIRELEIRAVERRPLDEELRTLAGLRRIQYVFLYPETGEIVLAGPAGDWYLGQENRMLSVAGNRPVVMLNDLLTVFQREFAGGDAFGCSIDPTPEGLQRLQTYVAESSKRPLAPGSRPAWSAELGRRLGPQIVSVYGVEPTSRTARTLVEADYRMKLIGIGKEEGAAQVPSYFELVRESKSAKASTMSLLRWWFAVDYDALLTSPERDVYELRGSGVKLLSENEFLAAQGQRVGSGDSDSLNSEFAARFTKHFESLAVKHPIYAELQNIFDLALTAAVIRREGLDERAGRPLAGLPEMRTAWADEGPAPTTVDSVVNSTELSKTLIMAAVSGGVRVDVSAAVDPATIAIDNRGALAKIRGSAAGRTIPPRGWWWD